MLELAKPVKISVLEGKSLGQEKSLQRNRGVLAGFLTPQAQGEKGNSRQPAVIQGISEAEPRGKDLSNHTVGPLFPTPA